jgi:hypothetical protein
LKGWKLEVEGFYPWFRLQFPDSFFHIYAIQNTPLEAKNALFLKLKNFIPNKIVHSRAKLLKKKMGRTLTSFRFGLWLSSQILKSTIQPSSHQIINCFKKLFWVTGSPTHIV